MKQKYPESDLDIPALEKKLDDIIAEGLPIWQERHAEEEKRKKEQEKRVYKGKRASATMVPFEILRVN